MSATRLLRRVINEKRETGNHLWILERDEQYDIMQIAVRARGTQQPAKFGVNGQNLYSDETIYYKSVE